MKSIILFISRHGTISLVLLLVLALTILVVVVNPKGEQDHLQGKTTTGNDTKMDNFKSGTYKPAKEIGY
jgi:hypothetical protein